MKMRLEMTELKKIVKRSVAAINSGGDGATEAVIGSLTASQEQAIRDFRASVEQQLEKDFVDTVRNLPGEESDESEVR